MVKNCVKKSNTLVRNVNGLSTGDKLEEVLVKIHSGAVTCRAASRLYNIPHSTLRLRLTNWKNKNGKKNVSENSIVRKKILSFPNEEDLLKYLNIMEKWGFMLSNEDLKDLVQQFVIIKHLKSPFRTNRPGNDVIRAFKKRNNLPIKQINQSYCYDPCIVSKFYDTIENSLIENNLLDKPHCIWNANEIAFNKNANLLHNKKLELTTVFACGNAKGRILPPTVIHKGDKVSAPLQRESEAYPGTACYVTQHGLMTENIFLSWFKHVFLSYAIERPALLIYDGRLQYCSIELLDMALAENVIIVKLPHNTSEILQPFSVSLFKDINSNWEKLLREWSEMHVEQSIRDDEFPCLLGKMWRLIDPVMIINGFKATGIYDTTVENRVNKLAMNKSVYILGNDEILDTRKSYAGKLKQNGSYNSGISSCNYNIQNNAEFMDDDSYYSNDTECIDDEQGASMQENYINDISCHFLSDIGLVKGDIHQEISDFYNDQDSYIKPNEDKSENVGDVEVNDHCLQDKVEEYSETVNMETQTINKSPHCSDLENNVQEATIPERRKYRKKVKGKILEVFRCNECPSVYTTKESLRRHSLTHKQDMIFQCSYCEKILSSDANLRAHITRHTGDKQFQCEVCTKTFTTKTGLRCHETIHLEEKPFRCEICDKVFNSKQSLRYHSSLHEKDKSTTCSLCGNSFTSEQGLRVHMKKHEEGKIITCSLCSKSCNNRTSLANHLYKSHNIEMNVD